LFTAENFIAQLGLEPHIEGGYCRELYQNEHTITDQGYPANFEGQRPLSSTIYYLLKSGQVSRFHRLKFDELWFYHYGSPLLIHQIDDKGELHSMKLGLGVVKGERPQIWITRETVFAAEVVLADSFSLVSCMVSPGFDYRDFLLFTSNALIQKYPQHRALIARINGPA
jgi:uncharacterized protein